MFSDILDGASRASGPVILAGLALAGMTYLMSQLIMHREAERAVPLCEAGYRAKARGPSLEDFTRDITREFLKQMLPKEIAPNNGWYPSTPTVDGAGLCRCAADLALSDDAGLRTRYWLFVGTLKLLPKPDFHAAIARRLPACAKET